MTNESRLKRQRAIVEILREGPVRSQDDIAARLIAIGHSVTQATVSRDLEQIGAVKVKRGGNLGYALPDQLGARDWAASRLERIFGEWVQSVETAGNLIVVRTPPGSAHVVCLAIDQAKLPEVVGTIAGDDTLFIAVRSDVAPEPLGERLRAMIAAA
ncbi:MAG TPA: arginine repressor [Sphingomicrobium sp.]|nr:arginine repressor [Sphingomicrobium sp.]